MMNTIISGDCIQPTSCLVRLRLYKSVCYSRKMFVSYTVKSHQFKETSEGRGILSYNIVDTHGIKRTISAVAHMGKNNKIKSLRPINKRELPLIQVLVKSSINERIEVDFTEYNANNPRGADVVKKDISIRKEQIPYDHKDHSLNDFDSIKENKFRVFQMMALAALVLAALMALRHSFF